MIEIKLHKDFKSKNRSFKLNVTFDVQEGDFMAIYGESGAGKTTLLRMVAGLTKPDTGLIQLENESWFNSDNSTNLSTQKREVGMVFQDYALFPNMSVRQNMTYALQKGQSKDIIEELIDIFELTEIQNEKSNNLSGGQQQRAAVARALVQKPKILLLDEPLSALDDTLRRKLQGYILQVHKKYELTTFIVSHDISEIFRLTNKVIKLQNGKIVSTGTPESLFLHEKNKGNYQVVGTIISIDKKNDSTLATVLSDQNVLKVKISDLEASEMKIGDKVMIVAKEFDASLHKL